MWNIYLNFCTIIGFGLISTVIVIAVVVAGIMVFTYLLDKSNKGV